MHHPDTGASAPLISYEVLIYPHLCVMTKAGADVLVKRPLLNLLDGAVCKQEVALAPYDTAVFREGCQEDELLQK